jgi:sulfur relay (sulfurtransferase) DsrC/TusE family protein
MLVKAMANKFGEEKGNSRYLYRLFPKARQNRQQNCRPAKAGEVYLIANTKVNVFPPG